MNTTQTVSFKVGETVIDAAIPNLMGVIAPNDFPPVPDIRAEIRRALDNPIGTPRLTQIAKGKKNAAIIVNDITRPYPGGLMVEELARDLNAAGLNDECIFLVVAYGNHRVNTEAECREMFGDEVVDRFRIVHHVATDPATLVHLGATAEGMVVEINKDFAEADLKITTGAIIPHQLAGFSGGRKSVIPGISGLAGLVAHHSFPIRPKDSSMGWMDNNPFHEQAVAGARLAGVDFIINSVENASRGIVLAVAGDLDLAHRAGVDMCRKIWTVSIPAKADVVVVSPGGYPRDFDLHQAQKAIGCAEVVCRVGGRIIMCAEARDGIAKCGKTMQAAKDPQEIIDKFTEHGYAADSVSKAYLWCRAVQRFSLVVTNSMVSREDLTKMFLECEETLEQAISKALHDYGKDATFLAMPLASEIIPVIEGE